MAATLLCGVAGPIAAASLAVTVLDAQGQPLPGAAVVAEPRSTAATPRFPRSALIDQRDLQFVPQLLVVQTGTAVAFPNSDAVLHHVYSYSQPKPFTLALYAGKAHPPVVFDKPGLVIVGCNIHDDMVAHIVVTDSPWHGISDQRGALTLSSLPEGAYQLRVWHPRQKNHLTDVRQDFSLDARAQSAVQVRFTAAMRAPVRSSAVDRSWRDY